MDPTLDEICKEGHTIKLEPKSMQLLICLAERAGEVLSVDELLDLVWKNVVVSPDSVYAAVAALRRILGDDPKTPKYIANVARRGYRLIAPVSPWVDPPTDSTSAAYVAPPISDKPSIAVIPFLNLSGDPRQEYFSDGVTADIITELSRWRRISVRSRSASFRYHGPAVEMKQVARELNVRFVVEGSVRRTGERIRISAQLIDAATGNTIWSEKFDRGLDEIFSVQDRVVQTIVSTLVGRLEASDTERARRKPPLSLAAYECVLKANSLSWDDPEGETEAARLVEKAIELDPGYALAHAVLAALSYSQWEDGPRNSAAAMERAYVLAMRGVELDAGESTCLAILGHACVHRRSYELALQYSRRAVEINPNSQWNAADLGSTLVYAGEHEEGLTWLARSREIDPYFDQAWCWRSAGLACMSLGRFADALSMLSRARLRTYFHAALLAGCHARLGGVHLAETSVADCLSMKPDFSIARFMSKLPFKNPADADQLGSSLRLAGLPE
ncbi:MAG: winged helix-turn-helix domain-containing protein [Steroidobacteraceae bacterium]